MAASSFEIETKRLQLLKKQYKDMAYSTWLADSAMKMSCSTSRHSEPVGKPPKYPTSVSTTPASSLSQPMLTPMKSKPVTSQSHGLGAFSTTDHSLLLCQTLHVSSELPPHHISYTAHGVSALLTSSASASSHLHYSTTTAPISHPVLFVPPSSVPDKEKTVIPFSYSVSSTPTLSPSTSSQETEDRISPFQPQAALSEISNSSKLLVSNPLSLQAPLVSLPSSSSKNIANLLEREPEKQTPSISPLSMSSRTSMGSSSECSGLGTKAELLPKAQNGGSKSEIEVEGSVATKEHTSEEDNTVPVQSPNEFNEVYKEEEEEEGSVVDELNQVDKEDISVPNKTPHGELPHQRGEEMLGSDKREVASKVEDESKDGQEEQEGKQQAIEIISKQQSLEIEEEKHGNENSIKLDGLEESLGNVQCDADKESLVASNSSLLEQSHTESLQGQPPLPIPASPSQHMSAYYKMVGQFTAQNAFSIPSLSSDGSDLEDDLRLAVTKSPDNEDPKSLDNEDAEAEDLLSLPDNTGQSPNLVVQLNGPTTSAKVSESPALVRESRKLLIDSTSLKRRMGLISSSEDDSSEISIKQGTSLPLKSPVHNRNIEFLDDEDDDDDDFDFYA